MKRKNYAFKFGLSFLILGGIPAILLIAVIIFIIIKKDLSMRDIFMYFAYLVGILFILFFLISLIGTITFYVHNPERLIEKEDSINDGYFNVIKKNNIKQIKARKLLFIYNIEIKAKPWFIISSLSLYFYNKEELTNFIKENGFIIQYIREKDLEKLDLK